MKLIKKLSHRIHHNALTRWYYYSESLILLQCTESDYKASADSEAVVYNDPEQLRRFVACESWHDSQAMVGEFMSRLKRGEKVASICCDGRLACYAWLNPEQSDAVLPLVKQRVQFPKNSSSLYNAYTHPAYRGRGLYKQVLNGIVRWAFDNTEAQQIVTAIEPDNEVALRCNLAIGFKPYARLVYRRLMGRERKEHQSIAGDCAVRIDE